MNIARMLITSERVFVAWLDAVWTNVMSKPDFSHLSIISAAMIAKLVKRSEPVTDDMFVKACKHISPPLLSGPLHDALVRELDPAAERRGRKGKGAVTLEQLAAQLRAIHRADIPGEFLEALAGRLEDGVRLTDADMSKKLMRWWNFRKRNMLIAGVYEEFYEIVKPEATELTHPILGTWPVSDPGDSRRDKALKITRDALNGKTLATLPGIDLMRNIVTEYNTGKNHKSL